VRTRSFPATRLLERLRPFVLTWIAACFAVSALGLGAHHGCPSDQAATQGLAHHHDSGKAPPAARCDCVGHACCHAPAAPPAPGVAVAVGLEAVAPFVTPRTCGGYADLPHRLPFATAPPLVTV
jgi:hypothetical protein